MSEFDRELINAISDFTDEGNQPSLRDAVRYYGSYLPRLIQDGFVAAFDAPPDWWSLRRPHSLPLYLSIDESLRLLSLDQIPGSYLIGHAPGATSLEAEPNLILRYAADEPDAITEVRRANAERRQRWEEQCR